MHSKASLGAQKELEPFRDPALAMDALQKLEGGRLTLETPPDPRTGATTITLDPLEGIHRITAHIPDPGRHCRAYSNRCRVVRAHLEGDSNDASADSREIRSTWARMIRKILEADPLVCSCGARIRIVSFITDPRMVDRILRPRQSGSCKTKGPFEPSAPPIAPPGTHA